jgi:hypothetical protein
LASRKLVDSGDRLCDDILGAGHAEARQRERQRQRTRSGPDRRVYARMDGTVPLNEDWVKKVDRWPAKTTSPGFKPFVAN